MFEMTLLATVLVPSLIIFFFILFVAKQYKRCPSNKILVIYGRVGSDRAAKCIHGGGTFVIPLIQDYAFLSLEPITIEIELTGALSKKNIRVNVPSTFTAGISTQPEIMTNASERLLGLTEEQVKTQARDIILGQLRLVIATLAIEEINQDREKFLDLVNKNVNLELNKIGLEVINVNIRDITDESGYIEAIGKKAAAEAINTAKVEVAQQERAGAIGEATATREREVSVASEMAQGAMGRKKAEADQRVAIAKYEAEGVAGEAESKRAQEVAIAEQVAKTDQGKKTAEREKRVVVAQLEAEAVQGENESKAKIADYNASLHEREAESLRRGEVARALAARDVLRAEKEKELAKLEKEQLAQREVEKRKMEVDAEAEAEQKRRIARGEADAILARYAAEAEGIQKVLQAKAKGYEELLRISSRDPALVPTLLMVEKLPELVEQQVRAIQNLKIDKITVWDGGGAEQGSSTANFLRSMITSLPAVHDLAKQVGIELPTYLGSLNGKGPADASMPAPMPRDPQ
ncbi:MAG: SPFH domain-containing protein [Oligoflexia bacterium]|nr:SPFH domain-containing protein [Oligoflexia bacterium]